MRSNFAFVYVTFVLCAAALPFAPVARAQNLSGRRAPSFNLPDAKGVQHDILDSRGKWLFIEYMDTNCPFCKDLSKGLEGLRLKYAAKMDIYAVTISPPANQQTVNGYIAETKINFPVLFDYGQTAISYFKATPQNPSFDTPHLFAIDPNGQIVKDWGQSAGRDPKLLKEVEALVTGGGGNKK
jgi:peroxiredoxin